MLFEANRNRFPAELATTENAEPALVRVHIIIQLKVNRLVQARHRVVLTADDMLACLSDKYKKAGSTPTNQIMLHKRILT